MIAYLNDFKLMFVATLLVVPLLLLIRPAGNYRILAVKLPGQKKSMPVNAGMLRKVVN